MEMDRRDGIGLAPVILFPFYRNEFYLSNQLVLVVVVMVFLFEFEAGNGGVHYYYLILLMKPFEN